MKARLNLATSPLETNRRFALGALLAGTVAIVALVWLSGHAYRVRQADSDLRAKRSALERRQFELQKQRSDLEKRFSSQEAFKIRDRAAFVNGLIAERSFPWTQIFMDLEHTLPQGVRVVSITPKLNAGRVELKLTLAASSDEAKLKCLQALEQSKQFTDLQLLSETHSARSELGDILLLDLSAWYQTT